jgi:ankyrin repeat protein
MSEAFLDAARQGDTDALGRMLDSDPGLLEARNNLGQGAVLLAKYHRQQAAVDYLLARGPELTLHEACAVGAGDRVRQLVRDRGRLIDAHSQDGFTPLALACYFGHPEIAAWLVDQGANIDLAANNPMRVAPIHAAVAARQFGIVEMLVANGANVNARQAHGFTPLHAAAQNGDVQTVRLLLEKGAEVGARSDNGQNALDIAMQRGHAEVSELLSMMQS